MLCVQVFVSTEHFPLHNTVEPSKALVSQGLQMGNQRCKDAIQPEKKLQMHDFQSHSATSSSIVSIFLGLLTLFDSRATLVKG